jgi:hypothetical protein
MIWTQKKSTQITTDAEEMQYKTVLWTGLRGGVCFVRALTGVPTVKKLVYIRLTKAKFLSFQCQYLVLL